MPKEIKQKKNSSSYKMVGGKLVEMTKEEEREALKLFNEDGTIKQEGVRVEKTKQVKLGEGKIAPTVKKAKRYKKKLSTRAKVALKDIATNLGKSKKQAMLDAGYSESYSNSSTQFMETDSVKTEFADFFPRDFIFKQLKSLHNAHKLDSMMFPVGIPDSVIVELLESINCFVKKIIEIKGMKYTYYYAKDNLALKNALDMSFKIMGEYTTDKNNPSNPLREMSDEELMAEINEQIKTFKKK